jgi:predicted O-methyltransferase YrrM
MAADLLPVNDDDNNNKIDEKLVTIEIDKNLTNIAKKNIDNAGLSNKIEVICGNALDVIPTLAGYKFDLIFLDAVKNEYLQYLRLIEAKDLLKEGTIVVADNVIIYENEMQDYLEYVRNSGRYNSKSTETTLEFTKNVKDALEISVRLGK